jgi:uncharacterized protein (DUF2461 family)
MSFTGVPPETFDFLQGLGANNSKDWFEGRRGDYDRYYIDVAKDLVVACGERIAGVVPGIQAQPKGLGSIFRINRDTRFSTDKRPLGPVTKLPLDWRLQTVAIRRPRGRCCHQQQRRPRTPSCSVFARHPSR